MGRAVALANSGYRAYALRTLNRLGQPGAEQRKQELSTKGYPNSAARMLANPHLARTFFIQTSPLPEEAFFARKLLCGRSLRDPEPGIGRLVQPVQGNPRVPDPNGTVRDPGPAFNRLSTESQAARRVVDAA